MNTFFCLESKTSTIAFINQQFRMELNTAFTEMIRNVSSKGHESREIQSWLMMSSIWPSVALTSGYLYFVILGGPKLMEGRKPYNLKSPMLVYNLLQVVFSSWIVIKGIKETYGSFFTGACVPSLLDSKTAYEVETLNWFYMMSKYVEFLDTIFFILRGKWNQVTFLHVYHHANMAIFTWVFVKYISGIQIFMIALCNSFVHAVMYGYYLLAALGPQVRRFLWWKRYITKLQIVQFVAIISFMVNLQVQGCDCSPWFILFSICNTSSFLVLFLCFYAKAYTSKTNVD
ncbi:unnamed protein product [Nezara viridula]|uniref:Elongation of very long chain fatty acids protein n=1 Tax=Nezara viridula TaxID=85310 RepID=A0A9P0H5G4_NEZVI|nr:unnamed protein product [Nezara viridula]